MPSFNVECRMKLELSAKIALCLTLLSIISTAKAQEYLSPGYILSEIQQGMGFYKVPDAPNFVKQSRPSSLDYEPLRPPPRDFHSDAFKPANRIEAEIPTIRDLETARARNQRLASKTGAQQKNERAKQLDTSTEGGSAPMKWNPWDTD